MGKETIKILYEAIIRGKDKIRHPRSERKKSRRDYAKRIAQDNTRKDTIKEKSATMKISPRL